MERLACSRDTERCISKQPEEKKMQIFAVFGLKMTKIECMIHHYLSMEAQLSCFHIR